MSLDSDDSRVYISSSDSERSSTYALTSDSEGSDINKNRYSSEILEKCCRTKVYCQTWRVKDINDMSESLESPKYNAGRHEELEWCLQLDTTSSRLHGNEDVVVSISPFLISNRSNDSVRAKFKISMLDGQGRLYNTRSFSVFLKARHLEKLPRFKEFVTIPRRKCSEIMKIRSNISVNYKHKNLRIQPLVEDLESLLRDHKHSDITIVINEKTILAHKNILASRSPVFASMFERKMEEKETNVVRITDIKDYVFEDLVFFSYTGKSKLISESPFNWRAVADLLVAADNYDVSSLKDCCSLHLEQNISVENACEILSIADAYKTGQLKKSVIKFINKKALSITVTEGWDVMRNSSPNLVTDLYLAKIEKN